MFDLKITGGTVLTPSGRESIDVGIKQGHIVALGALGEQDSAETVDATGLHVLPGIIDSQVHFREPGNTHKEDLESGTRSAVLGGVTAICEMPNTNPATTTPEALQDKLDRMQNRAWCDYAFFVGGTPEKGVDWHRLEHLPGCVGIKIFMGSSTGNLLVEQDEAIEEIFTHSTRRAAIHAEDEPRLRERKHLADASGDVATHPIWRDEESAIRATRRVLNIARKTGHPVHVLHITTAEELELLAEYKDIATVEVTPQHLTLSAEEYARLGTRMQMNPPIREARHKEALWKAIASGVVDVVGSDHAPHTLEEKAKPYPASPAGMPGVQTIVPLMLHHMLEGRLTLERMVDLLCSNPARIYGMVKKGRIARGYDADFTLVDLKGSTTLRDADMASKSGWTPFDGMELRGEVTHTIIRGHRVMERGQLSGSPLGKKLDFI